MAEDGHIYLQTYSALPGSGAAHGSGPGCPAQPPGSTTAQTSRAKARLARTRHSGFSIQLPATEHEVHSWAAIRQLLFSARHCLKLEPFLNSLTPQTADLPCQASTSHPDLN